MREGVPRVVMVRVCRPTIKARLSEGGPYALVPAGVWVWAMRCHEHDTSWQTCVGGRWSDAFDTAVGHQREFAEEVAPAVPGSWSRGHAPSYFIGQLPGGSAL